MRTLRRNLLGVIALGGALYAALWLTPVPAALALRLGSSLVFTSNRRSGGAHFTVTAHPPMTFTPSGDEERDIRDLTAAINARIEDMVRADPASWLWIHRRWPTARDVTGKRAP